MKKTLLLSGISAGLLLAACSTDKKKDGETEKYQVTHPLQLDTTYTQEYVAEIQAVQNVELSARVSGFLDEIRVDEGGHVKQGQVLFTISDREYQQELQKAKAALNSVIAQEKAAGLELDNTKTLQSKNIVSQAEVATAQARHEGLLANVEEAKADVASAELNLSYTVIKAPFDGVINRIPNKPGSLIEEGTLLTTISDLSEVFAYFNLSESEYLAFIRDTTLDEEKEVSLVLANNEAYPQKGKIETVESEIDRSTGNIAFRARFTNPGQLLKHGAAGKILMQKHMRNVVVIPQQSTFEVQENTYVFVVDANSVVHMRKVVPELRLPHLYLLQSGLSPDDVIVYEGIQYLKDEDRIVAEQVPMRKLMAEQSNK